MFQGPRRHCRWGALGAEFLRYVAAAVSLALPSPALLAQGVPLLEQVTVTANKRQQRVGEVDISLSVIDDETIRRLRLRSLPDAAALAENVELFEDVPGAGIPAWIIRGVGLQDYNSNNTPTAGVYLDEAYQVSTVMGGGALFDVDRIEVLKGPQGGLYGRNTSGGAVLLNTRRASLGARGGYLDLGYGRWDQAVVQGAVDLPVHETVALRLSGRGEHSNDGWQRTLASGVVHGARAGWDLRSWLRYQPDAVFRLDWKVQGGNDRSDIPLSRSLGLYAPSGVPTLCAALLEGRRDETNCINFGGVNRLARNTGEVPERLSLQSVDGSRVFSDPLNAIDNAYIGTVLDLSWQFSGWSARAISAFDDFGYGVALDLDGSTGEYGHRVSTSDIQVFSQELRVQSVDDTDLSWLFGLAWSREQFVERRDFNLRDNTLVALGRGHLAYEQDTDALALFADFGYRINAAWRVRLNLRLTDEEKRYRNGNLYMPGPPPVFITRDLAADYVLGSNVSGAVALNWEPSDDMLVYAKLSRGFKSGGFYGGFPFVPQEIEPYQEETINAVELGLKQSLPSLGLQFGAALFHYDYQDVQGFIQGLNELTGTPIDVLANQGDARHQGMELQVQWQPLAQLGIELGLAWLDARFVDTGQTTSNLLGEAVAITGQRPYAPRWSGNLLVTWLQSIAGDWALDWTLGWHFRSNFSGQQTSAAEAALHALPGYAVVNAGVALRHTGSPWTTRVWLRNALDKTYRIRVKSDGLNSYTESFGEPRSAGIAVEYRW